MGQRPARQGMDNSCLVWEGITGIKTEVLVSVKKLVEYTGRDEPIWLMLNLDAKEGRNLLDSMLFECLCRSSIELSGIPVHISSTYLFRKRMKRLSVTNLSLENNLLTFRLHYWGYTTLEVKGQWGFLLPPCLLITAVKLPVLHLVSSILFRVSSACAGRPSLTAPVLCHGPELWSPPSGYGGDSPMHALLQLTSPSSPSGRHLGVPSVSSPVSVWSLRCRPGHSCRGCDNPSILDLDQSWASTQS